MRNSRNPDFLATSGASESSLLLGPHLWVVHNDSLKCSKEGETSYKINLTLHACNTEQFACDNAFCVNMEKRCDAIEDCIDGSDELVNCPTQPTCIAHCDLCICQLYFITNPQ